MKSPAKTTNSITKPLVSAPRPAPAAALKPTTPAPAPARAPVSPTAPARALITLAPIQKSNPKPAAAATVGNGKTKAVAPKAAPVAVKAAAPAAAKPVAPVAIKTAASKPPAPLNTKSASKKPGTVETQFLLREESAQQVFLCGEFNQWTPGATPMTRQQGGAWLAKLALPPGRYQYKFVVDGQWMPDHEASESVFNEHGSLNSVIEIKG